MIKKKFFFAVAFNQANKIKYKPVKKKIKQ